MNRGFRMRTAVRLLVLAAAIAAAAGCGDVVRNDRSAAILNVDLLQGIAGGPVGTPSGVLLSDVLVLRRSPAPCTPASPCPTIVDDFGQATMSLSMKNVAVTPTTNNRVTISRYTVVYRRNDGRNTPGVDVPYGFDGAVTATVVPGAQTNVNFELVRHAAKEESPLVQLITNPNVISAVADVTFYGKDLVGNAVTATASLSVNFGDFADQ